MSCYSFIPIGYNLAGFFKTKHDFEIARMLQNLRFTIDLIDGSLVLFVFMFILSSATFVGVLQTRLRISKPGRNGHSNHRRLIRDVKFGMTMLVLNGVFLVCVLLWRLDVCFHINPFYQDFFARRIVSTLFADLVKYYYFSNFFIQLAVNSLLRKELWGLFKKAFSIFFSFIHH